MEKTPSSVHPLKRVLCLALAFVMLLGMVPVTRASAAEGTALYLEPNSNWLEADARFAIYYWNDSASAWTDMTAADEYGSYYVGTVPAGYTNIIFCRMNPSAAENDWANKWNQTSDLTLPTDGTNCYSVEPGTWDGGNGTWSVYTTEDEEPEESSDVPVESSEVEIEDDAAYYVAGDSALCGSNWSADDAANRMTPAGDGTYTITYYNVAAGTYNLKVTDGTWNNNWGDNGQNYTFVVSAACDVTVTFDPASGTVSVTGANVGRENGLEVTTMHAVGNGSGNWLNGKSWDVASNVMTETSENVYEITFQDVPAGTAYEFKFAANASWTHSWGKGAAAGEAAYNGQNIPLTIEYVLADVTLKLDLTGYNHGTKTGATYSVTVTEAVEEPTVDYYLVGYINGADYGCEADHENLGEYKFVDGKLTAKFDTDSYVFVKTGDNAHWYLFPAYTEATSGTLAEGNPEKMKVPGGKELEFTLVENADGTLTLSYAEVSTEPVVDYYLIGYINGADYGCNDDYANLGEYKFVDGKLTAKFDTDSYVFLKTGDNANWYMTQAYVDAASATFHNTNSGASEKMRVPGGMEYEFTLVVNEDDTLTLSYAEKADTTDVTLHFFKTEGWGSTINAYLWTSSGAVPGYGDYNAWPGKAISANAQHAGWYDLVVSLETPMAFNFIFNDGGNQTADLYTGEITGDTELWVVGSNVMTTAPGEWSGDYDYTANLYFQKPAAWGDTVNAWIWDLNGASIPGYEQYHTTWPGFPIAADAVNSGWYTVSVTMDENDGFYFIFNDGSNQTSDLTTGTLEVNTDLWIVDGTVLTEAPAGWRDPNRTIHVPGTFPGPSWDASSNQMSWDAELGLYVYTFENVPPANYEYKIAINGSWNENYGAGGVKDGSNIAVAVTETTDVTIYYNDETHNSVTSVSYIFADVTLSGTGIPAGTKLTDKGLSGIYSVTVPMTAGTYTDLVITCSGTEYAFGEVVIEEDKDVTFYMDPITEIFYCDASDIPVNTNAIYFDSQNETYKQPFGAAATGEDVTFAIDTGADITSAVLVVKGIGSYPMTAEETGTGKRWSATASFSVIGEYDYYFSLSNGSSVVIYSDDDGYYGEGRVTDLTSVQPYDLVVYKAGFQTPDWMKDAVIYQIFPDRFFDGDVSNNQAQTWARGEVNYEYITDWYTLPENPEQEAMLDEQTYKATGAHFGDGEWSNEIYGGDLEGITQRIGYLKALGVNVIYLNPVFWSISNHRYDAVDYTEIDPILGTMGDFRELVKVAEENGMHIILDGVFNHVSDDSVYFDRYYKFLGTSNKVGAYPYWAYVYDYMAENNADKAAAEAAAKDFFSTNYGITDYSYTNWFAVSSKTMAGTVDDIGLRAGKEVYSYEGWWGYDSMPVIYSTNGSEYQTDNWAEEIIYNAAETSVTQYWITQGNNGWRLDVANEVSDETWQRFRESVKALDSDAVIIGEIWDDATKYLKGDMYDSVMNYLFRNAATSFAMGSDAADTMKELEKIRERYPEEAFYAMMNLVGSHDTTRLLSYLDGIGDDRNDKDLASAFPTYENTSDYAKQMQYLVAFLQFTYAGAPTIYYGDEIGMVGADDPDDRRAMEWGKGSRELVEWYAKLAAIREAYPALRTGSVEPLELENTYDLLCFVRRDGNNTVTVIANNAFEPVEAGLEGTYVDLITGEAFDGTVPACSGVILVAEDEVKAVSVNYAGLAPAYDPAYTVAERPEGVHIHKYEAVVTEPTCTEGGYTTYTCDCGDSYVSKEVPALGHTEEAAVTDPTCTEGGFTTYTCTVCGNVRTDNFTDALGHSYISERVENLRVYTCERCDHSYEVVITQIASGKSLTLKFVHPETGKKISASKANWEITEFYVVDPNGEEVPFEDTSAYVTLKKDKLSTKKCGDQIYLTVRATLKADETVWQDFEVEILPAATKLSIWALNTWTGEYDSPVFSYPFYSNVNVEYRAPLRFIAATHPNNANTEVEWKVSSTKLASLQENPDGSVTVLPVLDTKKGEYKTGTVTITATAADGSGKKASFKVKFVKWANWVNIYDKDGNELPDTDQIDWRKTAYTWDEENGMTPVGEIYYYKGFTADAGTSVQLTAKADLDQKVTWACDEEYATISKSGKLTIKADAPDACEISVYARVVSEGIICCESKVIVTVNNENPPAQAMTLYRCEKTETGYWQEPADTDIGYQIDVSGIDSAENVPVLTFTVETDQGYSNAVWKSSKTSVAKVGTPYQHEVTGAWLVDVTPVFKNGKCATGTTTITATVDGQKASIDLTFLRPITEMEIVPTKDTVKTGIEKVEQLYMGNYVETNVIYATAGQSLSLKVVTNEGVSNKGFTWIAEQKVGATIQSVKISASGTLSIPKNIVERTVIWVWANPNDSSNQASIPVIVSPIATNVHLRADFGDGIMKYVSNTTKTWDVNDSMTLELSSLVYPFDAGQDVNWTVSNKNIATIKDHEDGTATLTFTDKKFGKLTITGTAADGSKVKTSFTLNVAKSVQNIDWKEDAVQVVAAGKTLNLAKQVSIAPSNATNKKLEWSIVGENPIGAKINKSSGVLTTYKNRSDKVEELTIAVKALDGFGAEQELTVMVYPVQITKVTVSAEQGGAALSGTQKVTAGETLTVWAVNTPVEGTAGVYTCKTSNAKVATVIDNGDGSFTIAAIAKGSAKITLTSADGCKKSATVQVSVVPAE